jgi:hypothetical protein
MALCLLYSYGFYKPHCLEALELTKGDVGVALEVLLSQYFKLGLTFPFITNNGNDESVTDHLYSEILQQREEEKCALESIYDSAFEERIVNRLWVLNLHLEYLLDLYSVSNDRDKEWSNQRDPQDSMDSSCDRISNKKPKSQPEFCRLVCIALEQKLNNNIVVLLKLEGGENPGILNVM